MCTNTKKQLATPVLGVLIPSCRFSSWKTYGFLARLYVTSELLVSPTYKQKSFLFLICRGVFHSSSTQFHTHITHTCINIFNEKIVFLHFFEINKFSWSYIGGKKDGGNCQLNNLGGWQLWRQGQYQHYHHNHGDIICFGTVAMSTTWLITCRHFVSQLHSNSCQKC